MQHSDDPAIRELALIVDRRSDDISDSLSEMLFAATALLLLLYRKVNDELRLLRREVDSWADSYFADKLEEYSSLLGKDFSEDQLRDLELIVDNEKTKFLIAIGSAIGSIQTLTARFQRGQIPSKFLGTDIRQLRARGSDNKTSQANARLTVRTLLMSRLVQVIGKGSHSVSYSFDYYASLLAHHANQNIRSQAVRSAVLESGNDLVRISPQPSTIGDFCDLYKGKVFSISGRDKFFHPLSLIPNGGCPMHPWCRHYLMPFDATKHTTSQLQQMQEIPDEYLELGAAGGSANDFQRLWLGS